MRDDFNKAVKETLSKRVGLRCSNPKCRRLTIGPNSNEEKTTNIGVAAHITAASPGGPRYDKSLNSQERSFIKNGVWLCQSCAKLIDSDPDKYPIDLLVKWKKDAEKITEQELNEKQIIDDKYRKILALIPDLKTEMQADLESDPLAREFILMGKNQIYNSRNEFLVYYYEDHPDIEKKIRALQNVGLIEDITYNNTKRYVFTEEFVEILIN
ncbi:hypothetical protein ACXR6G_20085 [Ancylomarina sp. YFZ004]